MPGEDLTLDLTARETEDTEERHGPKHTCPLCLRGELYSSQSTFSTNSKTEDQR